MTKKLNGFWLVIFGMTIGSGVYAAEIQEYYPLAMGNSWTYFSSGEEENDIWSDVDVQIISRTELVNGVETMRLVSTSCAPQHDNYENLVWDDEE